MNDENPLHSLLEDESGTKGTTVFSRMRGYFLAGILVTAPIGLTVYLTWIFLQFIDNKVTAVIPYNYNPFNYLPSVQLPGVDIVKSLVSLIVVIFFFILVGWFARNVLGRLIYGVSEYIVARMPVINNLYKALKQIFETIMSSQAGAFREVIMMEYPRKGVWSIGFVTGTTRGEVQHVTADETINVFVPTTPNPTSGYLLFVPKKEVHYLDMSVEEAVKLVVSAGIIVPPDPKDKKKVTKKASARSRAKAISEKKAAKKTSATKAAAKTAAKASSPKKTSTKKTSTKRATSKKAPSKAAAKKAPAKKAFAKKVGVKKAPAKKKATAKKTSTTKS
jgi:uncharacterized membrane protein